jgi:hypothetical protein
MALVGACHRGDAASGAGETGDETETETDTGGDDLTPPTVEEVFPEDGAEAAPVDTQIRAVFSEALQPDSVDATSFVVDGVTGTVAWNPDDLTATFTPQAPLDPLTSYTATLSVGIEDLAGNPLEAPVTWQFSTSTAGEKVSGDTPAIYQGEAGDPAIAFDDAGHGLAVWAVFSGSDTQLVASTYDPDQGTWSEVSLGRGGLDPVVASDGSGFMVAWQQIDGPLLGGLGERSLRARHHDGTGFGPETTIEAGAQNLSNASLAGGPAGYAVVWTEPDGSNQVVRASIHDGDAWSPPSTLHTSTSAGRTAIAASSDGFGAAWIQEDGGSSAAFVGSFDGATWSVDGETGLTGFASDPAIASDGTDYAVAWIQHGANDDLYGTVGGTGGWSAPVVIDGGTGSVSDIAVASNGSGFALGWTQDDAGDRRRFSSTYQGGWSAPATVSPVGDDIERFVLASDGSGYALSWGGRAGASSLVRAAVHDGNWSAPTKLSVGSEDAGFPALASDGSGYAATWLQFDPGSATTFSVHGRVFDGASWDADHVLDGSDEPMLPGLILAGGETGYGAGWLQWSGRAFDLTAAVHDDGSWKAAQVVSSELRRGSVMLREVDLAANDAGVVVATWAQIDASLEPVLAEGFTSVFVSTLEGGDWSAPERIGVGGLSPAVASDGTGFAIAWIADDGAGDSVYAVDSDDGIGWSTPELIETIVGDASDPVLASDGDTYMAAWRQENPAPATVMANLHDAGGWVGEFPTGSGGLSAYSPSLASNGTGYAVAWNEYSGTEYDAYVNRWDGGGFVGPAQLDTGSDPAWWPKLASNGSGYAVVWSENALGHTDVYASRFGGTTWTIPVVIESAPDSVADVVVVSDGSDYAAAWRRSPSARASVFDGSTWSAAHDVDPGADTVLEVDLAPSDAGYALAWTRIIGPDVHTRMATGAAGNWDPATSLDGLESHDGYAVTPRIIATEPGSWLTTRLQTYPASAAVLELWAQAQP